MIAVFILVAFITIIYICLEWDMERQLKDTYEMFETTGFMDVDQRYREVEALKKQIDFLKTMRNI